MSSRLLVRLLLFIFGNLLALPVAAAGTQITIGSAISMKEAMEQVAAAFSAENKEQRIALTFGSTATIVRQIQNGAGIDLFISADLNNIETLIKSNHVQTDSAVRIAGNQVLLVAASDSTLADATAFFAGGATGRIALCDTSVPIGQYADSIIRDMNVREKIKSRKVFVDNVRTALIMVLNKAVQAAFVYRTDFILHSTKLRILPLPASVSSSAAYYAAKIKGGSPVSEKFLAFLKSKTAKNILSGYGFQP